MTTYRKIFGKQIQNLSTDPTNPETEGQIWFNTTSGVFKSVAAAGAWSNASPMSIASYHRGGGGTPTAMFAAGGGVGTTDLNETEEYNGTGWTAGGDIGIARNEMGSAGTQTAGLIFGGYKVNGSTVHNDTEEYNGTSWSEQDNLNTTRYSQGGFGTQTAAVYGSGFNPGGLVTDTEEYNGTSWSEGNNPAQARYDVGTGGTLTAGIIFGGGGSSGPVVYANTELYDGTNWTAGPAMNTARQALGGSGTQTAAIGFGGRTPPTVGITEQFDGTSWTEVGDLATARKAVAGNRINTGNSAAIAAGGQSTTATVSLTEEWNFTANTVVAAAWASGANYPTGMNQLGGSGTQTAGLGFGGNTTGGNPNGSNVTAEYNGSSWTSGGNLATAKDTASRSGVGTQTATMCINFRNDGTATPSFPIPPPSNNYRALTEVEEYNGSSWTAGTATPDGEVETGTCGTVSAALRFGGNPGNPPSSQGSNGTLYWNDSSWTSLNNMSTGRYGLAPAFQGTYNAALGFGGNADPAGSPRVSVTEEFDGTNWTAGGNLIATVFRGSGSGTQTAALSFGGSPNVTATEGYDGTTWSTRPSLANGRSFGGGAGSSTAALYIAGDEGIHVEEFTGETTAVNVKTLTSS